MNSVSTDVSDVAPEPRSVSSNLDAGTLRPRQQILVFPVLDATGSSPFPSRLLDGVGLALGGDLGTNSNADRVSAQADSAVAGISPNVATPSSDPEVTNPSSPAPLHSTIHAPAPAVCIEH